MTALENEFDREGAAKAALALIEAFIWEETPQGFQYWAEVERSLWQLAGDEGRAVSNHYAVAETAP